MHTLFFDIASHTSTIACCTKDSVLGVRTSQERIGDKELLPILEDVLQQAQWEYADLSRVACISGPGGFTGLRIAAACANTLADQLKIPSAGVHMSDYYRARIQEKDFLWHHSTKKTGVFVRGFGMHEKLWPEPTYIELDQLISQFPQQALWGGELLPEHQEQLNALECSTCDPVLVLPDFLSHLVYTTDFVLPWYGRTW